MSSIDTALQGYSADDKTWKLLNAVFTVVPGAPDLPWYSGVNDAVRLLRPGADAATFDAVRAAAETDGPQDVLWMAQLLDKADSSYAVFTGVKSALGFFFGDRAKALDVDDQQRNDAAMKAIALAYMAWKAYPGSVAEKAQAMTESPNGRSLLTYYAAVEVALPFADNAAVAGGSAISGLFEGRLAPQFDRLKALGAGRDLGKAGDMLEALGGRIDTMAAAASKHVGPLAYKAAGALPGVMKGLDTAAGAAASAADVLPVYRLLGARLAAEAAVLRA